MVSSRYSKSLPLRRIHGSQGTGQELPQGDHAAGAGGAIPDRGSGGEVVRGRGLVWRAGLRALRLSRHVRDQEWQAHAVSVPRLQAVLQREDGNGYGGFTASRPQVGLRDLPRLHEPQGCCVDEAAPRSRRHPEDRLVHAAAHPRSVPCGRPHGLRRAGRSGRNLFRRSGEEQACVQEAEGWPWSGRQDGGGRGEGSGYESRGGSGDRGHGQEDATGGS